MIDALSQIEIHVYACQYMKIWDEFILAAKNPHFMFLRNYMDYHQDRFQDFSLMIYDDGKLVAILPGNKNADIYYSHQGLTFGGFVMSNQMKVYFLLILFEKVKMFLLEHGFKKIVYKAMPHIYHNKPCEEDLYVLFRNNAVLYRRDVSSAINLKLPTQYSKGRKYNLSLARKNKLLIEESTDLENFWILLGNVLGRQHNAKPVHSLSEIVKLKSSFPKNIRLFVALKDRQLLAGAVVYETELVAHTQYLASSEEGKAQGALDCIIDHLISTVYSSKAYFDFGISTEDQGKVLNAGLIAQKEGFGARAIVHDFYEITL